MFKMKRSKKSSQQSTTQKTKNTETDVNQWRPDNTMFKMKRTKKTIIDKALLFSV
jgi:formylmethanofuran dehydrogenase subunit E